MINLALISPHQGAYSETFVQAHRDLLDANVCYYFDGYLARCLEGEGTLSSSESFFMRQWLRASSFLGTKVSARTRGIGEEALLQSSKRRFGEEVLLRSFKRQAIQVVLAEFGPTGVGVMPVCKVLDIPLVVHFHGYDISVRKLMEEYRKSYRELFDYASYVVGVSQPMCERLIELGAPEHKVVKTPCAPNDKFLEIQATLEEKSFVSIGRFVDKKAPYYSVLAFKEVLKEHPDAKLYMAGDGLLFDVCRNLVRAFGMQDNVIFLGVIKPEEFRESLSRVRGFVQHSIVAGSGDMEGTPVAVLEAQAAGVPVVSTRHAGIPEVVQHGKTGFIVEEHDYRSMAEHICKLLEQKEMATKLGSAGRERVIKNYSMDKHIGVLDRLIRKSLDEHNRKRD